MSNTGGTETSDHHNYAVYTDGLSKRFGKFTAVDNIKLAVGKGEIFGFLGANGAGKTTAIKMFCGLLTPTSGNGWVNGCSIRTQAEEIRLKIGYMSQKFSLYDDLTIRENLEFFGGIYGLGKGEIRDGSRELAEQLGLTDRLNSLTKSLPLGFKQRLALGCAVLHKPAILFLDEPTGGVDPSTRRAFWELIYNLADNGTTLFVTTHYMDEAEYCGRISIMVDGRISELGSPPALKRAYGVRTMQELFLKVVSR